MGGIGIRKVNQIPRLLDPQVDVDYGTYEFIKVAKGIMTVPTF